MRLFIDVDECELNIDNCENDTTICSNTIGYFECLCLPGYINPNGTSCQRKLNLSQINGVSTFSLALSF